MVSLSIGRPQRFWSRANGKIILEELQEESPTSPLGSQEKRHNGSKPSVCQLMNKHSVVYPHWLLHNGVLLSHKKQ